MLSQNKCGIVSNDNMSETSKHLFLRRSMEIYNKLPRGLMLCPNKVSFKKWLKKYHLMGEFNCFPYRRDNIKQIKPVISHIMISKCKFVQE